MQATQATVFQDDSQPLAAWEIAQGPIPYPAALTRMEARAAAIAEGQADNLVWLLEHEPVYTAGTSADPRELIGRPDIPVFEAGRGGRYTYHGPGQRVAYLMIDLKPYGSDIRRHVWRLEEMVIRTLADFDMTGLRRQGRIGVWIETPSGEAKIAAIGVRVRRWVAFHGLSLNVDPRLEDFTGIVPCGIAEFGVTSMAAQGRLVPMAEVDASLLRHFNDVFGQDRKTGEASASSL